MPLFGSKKETVPAQQPAPVQPAKRSSGLFSSRKTASPDRHTTTTAASNSPHRTGSKLSHGSGGGLLSRHHEDASIVSARERVVRAEAAEREADKALVAARAAVREAIAEVKRLEAEAAEEARLAKIKQGQAASLSKRGKMLGRHDHH